MGVIADVPGAKWDAIVIGRAGMDLYPDPPGTTLLTADRMVTDLGGSAGNIAVALARQGAQVAIAAPVSADAVGDFVADRLRQFGVVTLTPAPIPGEARTSLALAETRAEGRTVIYRNNAADFQLKPLPPATIERARTVIVTGTALAAEPSRGAAMAALRGAHTSVLDLDYRPYSWPPDPEVVRSVYAEAMDVADIVVGNDDEFAQTAPDGMSGEDQARALSKTTLVIYKMGARGARVVQGGQWDDLIPPFTVDALKPFGAGDAFLGASLSVLLRGMDIALALRFGAAAAALVVSRVGCASAMPDRAEVEAFIASRETRDA